MNADARDCARLGHEWPLAEHDMNAQWEGGTFPPLSKPITVECSRCGVRLTIGVDGYRSWQMPEREKPPDP